MNNELRREFEKINKKLDSINNRIDIFIEDDTDITDWIDNIGDEDE